jgi:hypothetical protein
MNCYTHAPWCINPIGTINDKPADWQITDMHGGVIATVENHNQADADLIAAAPELLMFLIEARKALLNGDTALCKSLLLDLWCTSVVESLQSREEAV